MKVDCLLRVISSSAANTTSDADSSDANRSGNTTAVKHKRVSRAKSMKRGDVASSGTAAAAADDDDDACVGGISSTSKPSTHPDDMSSDSDVSECSTLEDSAAAAGDTSPCLAHVSHLTFEQNRDQFDKQRLLQSDDDTDPGGGGEEEADATSAEIKEESAKPVNSDSADDSKPTRHEKTAKKTGSSKGKRCGRRLPARVRRLLTGSLLAPDTDSSDEDAVQLAKYRRSKPTHSDPLSDDAEEEEDGGAVETKDGLVSLADDMLDSVKSECSVSADVDGVSSTAADGDGDPAAHADGDGDGDPAAPAAAADEAGETSKQLVTTALSSSASGDPPPSSSPPPSLSPSQTADPDTKQPEVPTDSDSDSAGELHKQRSPVKHGQRRRRRCVVVDSDSDAGGSQSDASCTVTSQKRRRVDQSDASVVSLESDAAATSDAASANGDSSDDFVPDTKRRRRVRMGIDKDDDDDDDSSASDDSSVIIDDDDDDDNDDGQGRSNKKARNGKKVKLEKSPLKSGRKNIRQIKMADFSTKQASQSEQARRARIEEKQKLYNTLFKDSASQDQTSLDRLILDFDAETKKELVAVHKNFIKILKPHQAEGVRFMFDSTVESVQRLNDEEQNSGGDGCILAHCMGLGKTLQVVVLLHTLLESSATRCHFTTALVICPKSTVQNWVRELKQWQRKCRVPSVDVIDITFRKDNHARSFALSEWRTDGGVCVLSYDMYKRLAGTGGKKGYNSKQLSRFQESLVDPGPDIVICDEGHLLKNPKTATFKCVNRVKTLRRVILTGTPLQNNLREYHTMVEFVKPKLLGSESEFSNRFVRPIENGSAVDAVPKDVRLMKRRSHVLHKLLVGVVQRRDYNVLTPFLPAKHEYVLMVRLCDTQRQLYAEYLANHVVRGQRGQSRGVLPDFQALSRIWTHPRSIQLKDERNVEEDRLKEERKVMKSFIHDHSDTSDSDVVEEPAEEPAQNTENSDWWKAFIPDDVGLDSPELSGKLSLLLQILIKSETIGDKVLVFSQSLFSLDLIEEHLKRLHREIADSRRRRASSAKTSSTSSTSPPDKHPADVYFGTWRLDADYFRLDGSVAEDKRQQMCDKINRSSDERARLMLISTRAGGLGINLVGANRVVIFDASWNPTADSQAIFRVFRFGQLKPCYIYRFLAQGSMEEKIYDRQITKLSLAGRVVDEQQIERHFSQHDVEELYRFEPDRTRTTGVTVPKDDMLLMELLSEPASRQWVSSVHGHDSLLQNVEEEELNADEQRAAWEEYENDKKGLPNFGDVIPLVEGHSINKDTVIDMIRRDNPDASEEEVRALLPKAIQTLRAYYLKRQQEQRADMEMKYRQMLAMQHLAQLTGGGSVVSALPRAGANSNSFTVPPPLPAALNRALSSVRGGFVSRALPTPLRAPHVLPPASSLTSAAAAAAAAAAARGGGRPRPPMATYQNNRQRNGASGTNAKQQ